MTAFVVSCLRSCMSFFMSRCQCQITANNDASNELQDFYASRRYMLNVWCPSAGHQELQAEQCLTLRHFQARKSSCGDAVANAWWLHVANSHELGSSMGCYKHHFCHVVCQERKRLRLRMKLRVRRCQRHLCNQCPDLCGDAVIFVAVFLIAGADFMQCPPRWNW